MTEPEETNTTGNSGTPPKPVTETDPQSSVPPTGRLSAAARAVLFYPREIVEFWKVLVGVGAILLIGFKAHGYYQEVMRVLHQLTVQVEQSNRAIKLTCPTEIDSYLASITGTVMAPKATSNSWHIAVYVSPDDGHNNYWLQYSQAVSDDSWSYVGQFGNPYGLAHAKPLPADYRVYAVLWEGLTSRPFAHVQLHMFLIDRHIRAVGLTPPTHQPTAPPV